MSIMTFQYAGIHAAMHVNVIKRNHIIVILGVSRYGKSVLRYFAIHDNRITIRIAIYCHWILLLKKDQTN
jgi:hypothetical protein